MTKKNTEKKRLARIQAEHIKERSIHYVDVERLTEVLHKGMTTDELRKAISNWNK